MTFNYDKQYDQNLDRNFLEAHGVIITQLLPWQFRLEHPDIVGRFIWYPKSGSLIYEKPEWGVSKVGEFIDSEDVYDEIMKKAK